MSATLNNDCMSLFYHQDDMVCFKIFLGLFHPLSSQIPSDEQR